MTLFNICRGEYFRPKCKYLGDLTCIFPNAAHLAVTATATPTYIHMLGNVLQYNSPVIVHMNPDRSNISIEVKTRLPNIKKYDEYNDIIEPLSNELKTKLTDFPVTIVYVESLEALGYFHQFLNYELKDQQFVGEAIPENRIFAQYHKDYTQAMKQHIISELIREVPKVRLTLATVALGMGIDAPSLIRIIHVRPPTTLEMMEFYVLLAPNPRIRSFNSLASFSFCKSAALFLPAPP